MTSPRRWRPTRATRTDTARLEHDRALQWVMVSLLKDDTELHKQFVQHESFRRFVTDMVFALASA